MMQFVTKGKNNAGNDRNFSIGWHPNPRISIGWFNPAGSIHEWAHDITLSTGQWYHFYMEIDTTTNPDTVLLWIDGVSKTMSFLSGTNNSDMISTATQEIAIGREHGGGNQMDGLIAEVGIWSDIVGESRALMLSKGFSPAFFRNNLTEYIPLIRNLHNLKGGTGTMSASNPVVAAHPKIIHPSSQQLRRFTTQAAPAGTSPKFYRAMMGVGF